MFDARNIVALRAESALAQGIVAPAVDVALAAPGCSRNGLIVALMWEARRIIEQTPDPEGLKQLAINFLIAPTSAGLPGPRPS